MFLGIRLIDGLEEMDPKRVNVAVVQQTKAQHMIIRARTREKGHDIQVSNVNIDMIVARIDQVGL